MIEGDSFKPVFKAEMINGVLEIKPIIERKGKDLIIHVPSLKLINTLKKDYGVRNIQQI